MLAPTAVETQAVGPDRGEMGAARRHLDGLTSTIEQRRERAADGPSSDHADSHAGKHMCPPIPPRCH